MNPKLLTFSEHLSELKMRLIWVLFFFISGFALCYHYKEELYEFSVRPLYDLQASVPNHTDRRLIYTGLAEVFLSYIKLSCFGSICIILPVINLQIYLFLNPALKSYERKIALLMLSFSPILFWLGIFFTYSYVMPKAWSFFASFERFDSQIPMIMEAKVNEYLNLVIDLFVAFGIAFQLPIAIVILNLLGILSVEILIKKRRFAILFNFIIAGIITPPDVLSQIALAIPMLLLYEVSVFICKLLQKKRSQNA
jgi:sec-independent protein translocase protein TatC